MNAPAVISITSECSPPQDDGFQAAAARLRDACQEAWMLIEQIGPNASDERKLEVLLSPRFSTAAFSVRSALVLTCNLHLRPAMYYTPGPGDLLAPYGGHPHDPRTEPSEDDDPTLDVINDLRQFLDMAEAAATQGDWSKAKHALIEARLSLEDLVGEAR